MSAADVKPDEELCHCPPDVRQSVERPDRTWWCALCGLQVKTMLARLEDTGLAPDGADGLDPREIVARIFEHPIKDLEKRVEVNRVIPFDPTGAGWSKVELDVGRANLGLLNKVTPEMLIAVVANIIATSPTAAMACARLRVEVSGWRFQDSAGNVDRPSPEER